MTELNFSILVKSIPLLMWVISFIIFFNTLPPVMECADGDEVVDDMTCVSDNGNAYNVEDEGVEYKFARWYKTIIYSTLIMMNSVMLIYFMFMDCEE